MDRQGTTAILLLLLTLATGQAQAGARPLQLGFVATPSRPDAADPMPVAPGHRAASTGAFRPSPRTGAATQPVRQRALQSVLDPPQLALDEERPAGGLQLKFKKRGNAFRDLGKSYREMCDRASAKIWDEPNGKRVRFDVAGRPGVGVEIPIR